MYSKPNELESGTSVSYSNKTALIQDEENLLEMKIRHWLAKLYIYHVQCNFWGNSTLVEHSCCGVVQVRGDVLQCTHLYLGFDAAGCASSTDIKNSITDSY